MPAFPERPTLSSKSVDQGVVTRSGKSTNPTGRYDNENSDSDSEIYEFKGDDDHPDPVPNPESKKVTNMSHLILIRCRRVKRVM